MYGLYSTAKTKRGVPVTLHSTVCALYCLVMFQAVLDSQKTSVPGDLIAIPGATEKISFAKHYVNANMTLTLSAFFL